VIRLHEYPGGYLLYVLNHGKTTEKVTIKLNVPSSGSWELVEMLGKRSIKLNDKNRILELTTGDIGEKSAEIWNIKRGGRGN
jgi:hypothetical protein